MSSLSARTAPFQVAFIADLRRAPQRCARRKGRSFAGREGGDASGLPAPGMLYRGGRLRLDARQAPFGPLEAAATSAGAGWCATGPGGSLRCTVHGPAAATPAAPAADA